MTNSPALIIITKIVIVNNTQCVSYRVNGDCCCTFLSLSIPATAASIARALGMVSSVSLRDLHVAVNFSEHDALEGFNGTLDTFERLARHHAHEASGWYFKTSLTLTHVDGHQLGIRFDLNKENPSLIVDIMQDAVWHNTPENQERFNVTARSARNWRFWGKTVSAAYSAECGL